MKNLDSSWKQTLRVSYQNTTGVRKMFPKVFPLSAQKTGTSLSQGRTKLDRELEKGDIILAALPKQVPTRHEHLAARASVIVGLIPGKTRYRMTVGAPLTTKAGRWFDMSSLVYPVLQAGAGKTG